MKKAGIIGCNIGQPEAMGLHDSLIPPVRKVVTFFSPKRTAFFIYCKYMQ